MTLEGGEVGVGYKIPLWLRFNEKKLYSLIEKSIGEYEKKNF